MKVAGAVAVTVAVRVIAPEPRDLAVGREGGYAGVVNTPSANPMSTPAPATPTPGAPAVVPMSIPAPAVPAPATPVGVSPSGPLAPLGPTMVVGGALIILLALYALWVQRASMEASRRRLRIATSLVMIVLLGVLSVALTSVTPASPRMFLLAWSAVVLLVGLVLMLAVMDGFNTVRLYNAERAMIARQIALQMAKDARERGAAPRDRVQEEGTES